MGKSLIDQSGVLCTEQGESGLRQEDYFTVVGIGSFDMTALIKRVRTSILKCEFDKEEFVFIKKVLSKIEDPSNLQIGDAKKMSETIAILNYLYGIICHRSCSRAC